MRLVLCVLAALAVAGPALAALAPEYYQRARDTAPDVVVFRIDKVKADLGERGYGVCTLTGKVERVERGRNYRAGGPITVEVPCMFPNATPMAGGTIWQTPGHLRASHRGRAWMESPGRLALYQYEVLP